MKRIISFFTTLVLLIIICISAFFLYKNYYKFTGNLEKLIGNGQLITNYKNLQDTKYKGTNVVIDTTYHPYYGLLNSNEKRIYRQTYENIINFKTAFVPVEKTTVNSIDRVIESIMNDFPELFYLDYKYSYKYTKDNVCRQVILKFNGLEKNYQTNLHNFNNSANSIIVQANRLPSRYEKELYVHDALTDRISYVTNAKYNQTAYSALVNGKTVCAGYAKAFQYIMNRLGIPTYYVTGTSKGENHAWNIVSLSGGYYNVDVTWDDVYKKDYTYFNLTDNEFNTSHKRNSLSIYLPNCNATTYAYKKPVKKETVPKKKENNNTQPVPKPVPEIKEEENIEIEENIDNNEEEIINDQEPENNTENPSE